MPGKCANVLTPGTHGSTFGGNPISCAGGLAVLRKLNSEGFLNEVAKKSEYIRSRLENIPEVKSVSGIGLMIGIELKSMQASDIVKKALDKGLLLLTAKNKIRLLPPLTISYEEIDKGMKILSELLGKHVLVRECPKCGAVLEEYPRDNPPDVIEGFDSKIDPKYTDGWDNGSTNAPRTLVCPKCRARFTSFDDLQYYKERD